MEFEVNFTPAAVNEAARMAAKWWEWPMLLLKNLQGFALVCALFVAGCSLFLRSISAPKPDIPHAALGLLFCLSVPAVFGGLYRREARKQADHLAALNPVRVTFESDGLRTCDKSGEINIVPCSMFDGYREGKHFLLLADPLGFGARWEPEWRAGPWPAAGFQPASRNLTTAGARLEQQDRTFLRARSTNIDIMTSERFMPRKINVEAVNGHGLAQERRVATPRPDLFVIKVGDRPVKPQASSREQAPQVVARLAKIMAKPGIDRARVFKSSVGKPVYAYFAHPDDPTKIVREDVSGRQTIGRVVGGRYRAIRSARAI